MENFTDVDIYFRFIIALGLVFLLIGVAAWVARLLGFSTPLKLRGKSRRRLGVVDAIALDAKRRLILISRDEHEHLVCVGGDNDFVIETHIKSSIPLSQASTPLKKVATK